MIINHYQKSIAISHKDYKIDNKNNIEKKIKNNNIINKSTKLNNYSRRIFFNHNIPINNNNFLFLNHKYLCNSLNNCYLTNYIKNNIKTIDNHSTKNNKKNIKKKLNLKNNELLDDENSHLKRFKTEKNFELVELDKNIYQLIRKKKKNLCLDKEVSISINHIKSFELKKNQKLTFEVNNPIYQKRNTNIESKMKVDFGINGYKLSPIKSMDKKNKDEQLYLVNDLKKKKNKKNIEKINNDKNCIKSYPKKEKKNLSMQIETKHIYQNNINNKKEKNKNFLDKKNNSIENINNDINNSINIYNTIQIRLFDSSNNKYSRNHNSINNNNDSTYYKRTNIKINKRNIGNLDFDFIIKESSTKFISKKQKIKNKVENKLKNSKIKNIKNYELKRLKNIYKNKSIKKNNDKIKYFNGNEKKLKINDENKCKCFNKNIEYINDFCSEVDLDEDNMIRDTTQSTNNISKIINTKMQSHFKNVLKHRTNNCKIKNNPKISISLLYLFKNKNILEKIINFCNYDTINNISLLNKQHYKYIKPYIYEKIKNNIIKINNQNKYNNIIIKKSVLQYTPLSKLSPVMLQKKYIDLLYELNEKYDNDIKKDLLRTMPENNSFQYGNENYNKLYHILSAYSNYNKNIGYVQGLNFLAAHCLYIYYNEIDAFIFLDGLIRKFKLENLFGINNNELNQKLNEIECIVNKCCPEVNKYLQKIFLNYDFFTCKWIITLFSNHMNVKYLFQLWDYMIIFGWKFFRGFVISVIQYNEKIIIKSSLETITKIMNGILRTKEFEDNFNNIIDKTFEYINKENDIL